MKKFIAKYANRAYGYMTGVWTVLAVLIVVPAAIMWWAIGSGKYDVVKKSEKEEE